MRKIVFIAVAFLLLSITSKSWAWGKTGHRVVAAVASHHLTDQARKNINKILQGHSMVEVANWMDDIKSDTNPDYDTLSPYHWVDIADGKTYAESNVNPEGDVIVGLHTVINALKKGGLSPKKERQYLKMLIHFVGDIHQPLHVGRLHDAGGNNIKVTWFGRSTNLHVIWDSKMIDSKKYSYSELAKIVDCCATQKQIKKWESSSIEEWAQECMKFRPQIYDFDKDKKLGYRYQYKNWGTVKLQLEKGGIRLAHILNEIYG